ncbi:MAG TPA: hypothetical protein VKC60_05020, partial [Opitutaceae bacterium]|nr:hypothetical protein [Opitutaceae bacterium]
MKYKFLFGCSLVFLTGVFHSLASDASRQTLSFDADWKFFKGDTDNAAQIDFNDASWRSLNVPHDWSIEGSVDEKNPTGGAGAYLPSGIGWYRKHFSMPAASSSRRIFVEFDGVMANSEVWINGTHLGKRPYGYVSFRYELTGYLNFDDGKSNILSVRTDTSAEPASRWYTGAGIYRHVRLVIMDPVHLEPWSTFVSTPKVTVDQAVVHVQSTVVNQSEASRKVVLRTSVTGPDGKLVQRVDTPIQSVEAGKTIAFQQDVSVKSPKLWDLEKPVLYQTSVEVRADNIILDQETVPFGIRDA